MSTRLPTASSAVVSFSREARVSEGTGTKKGRFFSLPFLYIPKGRELLIATISLERDVDYAGKLCHYHCSPIPNE